MSGSQWFSSRKNVSSRSKSYTNIIESTFSIPPTCVPEADADSVFCKFKRAAVEVVPPDDSFGFAPLLIVLPGIESEATADMSAASPP
jgi:hypothetical protein